MSETRCFQSKQTYKRVIFEVGYKSNLINFKDKINGEDVEDVKMIATEI